ncbi:MarR family winged helix-turn-helix transcriptional regulator [Ruminococcaceae bacterium OttesenSCG-928-A16]|nr:MarR family winged helix-turn-helix transcriptional regulator [Ruminococcaceae bacterium OttesenSCG-928-A16]
MDSLLKSADTVSLFCRININTRQNIPIRSSEMGLLIYISQCKEPPSSGDAVTFFKVSKPMVAGMVHSLEKKGYLERGASPSARRRFTLLLTEKAKALVEETTGEYLKNMSLMREGLGKKNFETLIELLDKANQLLLKHKNGGDETNG